MTSFCLKADTEEEFADRMANINSQNSTNKLPRDAQVIVNMFQEAGIKEYDPRCVQQMLEFVHNYTSSILEDARLYANYAKKKNVDFEDIKLSINTQLSSSFSKPPPRDVLLQLAAERNIVPIAAVKPHCGIRLPPERFCLHQADYTLASKTKNKLGTAGTGTNMGSQNNRTPMTKAAMKNVPQGRPGGVKTTTIPGGVNNTNIPGGVNNTNIPGGVKNTNIPGGVNNTGGPVMTTGNKFTNQPILTTKTEEDMPPSGMVHSMDTL